MSYLRFNHVFLGLLALSFLSAFVLPNKYSETASHRIQGSVQGIFTPVAYPISHITGWVVNKVAPARLRETGSGPKVVPTDAQLLSENEQLKQQNAILQGEIQRLRELEAERSKLGVDIRDLCTHFSVAGADSAARQSLMLGGSSFDGLKEGMPVLYSGGVAGKIGSAGIGGARVLLITDRDCTLTVRFARYSTGPGGAPQFDVLPADPRVLFGKGDGTMQIPNVPDKIVKNFQLRVGDWLVLEDDDPEWRRLRNYKIGRIDQISLSKSPGFSDIKVVPDLPLMTLKDVMVLVKEKG